MITQNKIMTDNSKKFKSSNKMLFTIRIIFKRIKILMMLLRMIVNLFYKRIKRMNKKKLNQNYKIEGMKKKLFL